MTAEDYRDMVASWLVRRSQKWRKRAEDSTGAAADAASFYAAAYRSAADGVLEGKPERAAGAMKLLGAKDGD